MNTQSLIAVELVLSQIIAEASQWVNQGFQKLALSFSSSSRENHEGEMIVRSYAMELAILERSMNRF